MDSQIEKDFSFFQEKKIEENLIDRAFMQIQKEKQNFLMISIIDGQTHIILSHKDLEKNPRKKIIGKFFKDFLSKHNMQNVKFLISLEDGYSGISKYNVPIFTFAKSKDSSGYILFPDFEILHNQKEQIKDWEKWAKKNPWKNKKEIVFFRGGATGGFFSKHNHFTYPRSKIVKISMENPDLVDAAFFNKFFQTDCKDLLEKIYRTSGFVKEKDHLKYKYLIDIDGNSCTYSRCRWILGSNSVLLKHDSDNIQWYYSLLKPYENYVPITSNFENFKDQITWLRKNDKKAKKIAENGSKLAKKIFSAKDIEKYVLKLLSKYSEMIIFDDKNFDSFG
ncbi:MAG: hypothetical protein JXA94_01070 [Parachlamydiales bacterium]|nr:hypothetical protein [Parachlamydiales bacterium]